ncbi:MAG TPA: GNAT family N-acetyltransferase [Sphingomicrobium sp.]|nr:GNAT family N-acetyltransferase [Sphingomicrobium sp.]
MKTERLRLRPLRSSDAETLHTIHEIVGHGRSRRTLEELRALYREMEAMADSDPGWHGFVIELHDGTIIGDVGICTDRPEERQAEIGYSLHPGYWRAGYATEALTHLLDVMFSSRALHRVVAVTQADNVASRALLERIGFRLEAYYRSAFYDYRAEAWVDSVGYALLAEDRSTAISA